VPAIQKISTESSPVEIGSAIETAFLDSAGLSAPRFATEPIVTRRTKTEISLDIQEEVAVRAHRISLADCPVCRSEVRMLPANEAAMIAKVKAREIYELVNSGQLHFTEDRNGLLYICSESLRHLRPVEPDELAKATDTSSE
jgi:hypothetical protein